MLSTDAIQARVRELGARITAEYAGRELALVGVLKGSLLFMADLAREIRLPLTCDFLRVSSYEGMKSSGVVRFDFDLTQPIKGKDVLVVEDIIDTGLTMSFLLETLRVRHPESVKLVTLLDKPENRRAPVEIDYVGFTIENRFVIGYGLDLDGKYRNLPYIAAMKR
jgi:hypoxanthine phosphoribosyltransferase